MATYCIRSSIKLTHNVDICLQVSYNIHYINAITDTNHYCSQQFHISVINEYKLCISEH